MGRRATCPGKQPRCFIQRLFYEKNPIAPACLQWEEKCLPGPACGTTGSRNLKHIPACFRDRNALLPLSKVGQPGPGVPGFQPSESPELKLSVFIERSHLIRNF